MKIGLRQFGDETVHWFRQAAQSGELTRSGLARELCERTDWRTQRGDLCLAQARTVVPQLAARLNIHPGTKLLWIDTTEVMAGIRTLRALTAGKITM